MPIGSIEPNSNKENTSIRKPKPAPRKKTESRATPEVDNDQMSEDDVRYVVPNAESVEGFSDEASEIETSVASAVGAEPDTDVDGTVESVEAEEPEDLVGSEDELPVDSPRPQRHSQPPYWLRSGDFVTKAAVSPQLHATQQMPLWKEKAFCLAELCKSGVFNNTDPQILRVFLETMSGK